MRMLEDAEWRVWSDNEIARRCRVSHETVGKVRKKLLPVTGEIASEERTYTTKHGTEAKMDITGLKAK